MPRRSASFRPLPPLLPRPSLSAGCAAEGAVAAPLFSWTFVVPAEVQAPLHGLLWRSRAADRPGPEMSDALHALIAEARSAAAERDAAAAAASTAAAAAAKQSKKGAGKKAAKAAGAAAAAAAAESADAEALADVEADPHGVAAALRPQTDLAPSPELERAVASTRSQIRRYCTAVQVRPLPFSPRAPAFARCSRAPPPPPPRAAAAVPR